MMTEDTTNPPGRNRQMAVSFAFGRKFVFVQIVLLPLLHTLVEERAGERRKSPLLRLGEPERGVPQDDKEPPLPRPLLHFAEEREPILSRGYGQLPN